MAVPESEYETVLKQLEVSKQKNGELIFRNREQTEKISSHQTELRGLKDKLMTQRELQESKNDLEREYHRVRTRLEWLDPTFRWEGEIYTKIVQRLKNLRVSVIQVFENFDKNKDGHLNLGEFADALG